MAARESKGFCKLPLRVLVIGLFFFSERIMIILNNSSHTHDPQPEAGAGAETAPFSDMIMAMGLSLGQTAPVV